MKNKIFLVGLVALICLGFNASSNDMNTVFSSSHIIFANANNKEDFVYLSDKKSIYSIISRYMLL